MKQTSTFLVIIGSLNRQFKIQIAQSLKLVQNKKHKLTKLLTKKINFMENLDIAKFGGTSVANYEAMQKSAKVILSNKNTRLVVLSACAGVTNLLVDLASAALSKEEVEVTLKKIRTIHEEIIVNLKNKELCTKYLNECLEEVKRLTVHQSIEKSDSLVDRIVSFGELLSSFLMVEILKDKGYDAYYFDVRNVMRTDSNFGKANPITEVIASLCQKELVPLIDENKIVVTQGFIASNAVGMTTTLGRGGSDYSAALLGEALNAATISIWTDVPGVYTTDPRLVKTAMPIEELTYLEAAEMATFGAKILHPSTLVPAVRHEIPVYIGSSKEPELGGTWVKNVVQNAPSFRAVTLRKNQTLIVLASPKMVGASGFLAKVFEIFAKYNQSIDLVSTSEVSIAITLDQGSNTAAKSMPDAMLDDLRAFCHVKVEKGLSLVAIIGNEMSKTAGVTTSAFGSISQYPIRMICYGASNQNLCFLVKEEYAIDVLSILHKSLLEKN